MRAIRWSLFFGVGLLWATLQLELRVERGHPIDAVDIAVNLATGLVYAAFLLAANRFGERRAGRYDRLDDHDRALVDDALRTGVPHDDPRLRAVERARARRLASPGRGGAVFLCLVLAGLAAWLVWGWSAWPVPLRVLLVGALALVALAVILDLRRDRTALRAVIDATS